MKLPTLVEIAKSECLFLRYQDGQLWYCIGEDYSDGAGGIVTVDEFAFPIPVADAGEGSFLPEMKGIQLLRWARKHLEYLASAEESSV